MRYQSNPINLLPKTAKALHYHYSTYFRVEYCVHDSEYIHQVINIHARYG